MPGLIPSTPGLLPGRKGLLPARGCGETSYEDCEGICAAVIAYGYPASVTIVHPGHVDCDLTAGTYVLDFDAEIPFTECGVNYIYYDAEHDCELSYYFNCVTLEGGGIKFAHCFGGAACGCGTGCLYRDIPITLADAIADGSITLDIGVDVDFSWN